MRHASGTCRWSSASASRSPSSPALPSVSPSLHPSTPVHHACLQEKSSPVVSSMLRTWPYDAPRQAPCPTSQQTFSTVSSRPLTSLLARTARTAAAAAPPRPPWFRPLNSGLNSRLVRRLFSASIFPFTRKSFNPFMPSACCATAASRCAAAAMLCMCYFFCFHSVLIRITDWSQAFRPRLRPLWQLCCSLRARRRRRLRARVQATAAAIQRRAHASGQRQDVPARRRVSARVRILSTGAGACRQHMRHPARGQRGGVRRAGKGRH